MTIKNKFKQLETESTKWTIIDTPGHRAYSKTTIAGISQGDCAILVVSAVN